MMSSGLIFVYFPLPHGHQGDPTCRMSPSGSFFRTACVLSKLSRKRVSPAGLGYHTTPKAPASNLDTIQPLSSFQN